MTLPCDADPPQGAPNADFLVSVASPVTVGPNRTEIRDDPAHFAGHFARHSAIALSGMVDPLLLSRLLQICDRAQFLTDTMTDVARRQREIPPIAGGALALALKRPELLRWLEQVTGRGPLQSTFGRVMQNVAGGAHHLNWHDDLPEDRTRRLAITINMGAMPYEGGLFELRVKKTRRILARHRHETPGSALIFNVSDELEHRVWPITDGGPRRIFAGWFLAGDAV